MGVKAGTGLGVPAVTLVPGITGSRAEPQPHRTLFQLRIDLLRHDETRTGSSLERSGVFRVPARSQAHQQRQESLIDCPPVFGGRILA